MFKARVESIPNKIPYLHVPDELRRKWAERLAGALGKPVWHLNRFETEWLWMLKREDYPSIRIFHQQRPGSGTRSSRDPLRLLGMHFNLRH